MTLVPFATVDRSALRWLRTTDDPPAFTLLSGDQPIELLTWAKATGSLARAETSDSRWTLKRMGFLAPHLTLRVEGETADSARITRHTDTVARHVGENYHRIDFAGGVPYRFHRAGVQVPAWQITTDDRTEIAHVEPVREGRKLTGAAVLVSPEGETRPELAAVLAFAWYFVVLAWFEDEILLPLERVMTDLELR